MKRQAALILVASTILLVSPFMNPAVGEFALPTPLEVSSTNEAPIPPACLSEIEVSAALERLSSPRTYANQQEALMVLRADASRTHRCRNQVITALVNAMDQPRLDLAFDRPSFYLWHYGTALLADLKAVESLDFLIQHWDLDDGTPFPLGHHPSLVAVIDMGEIAIPKVEAVFRQSPDGRMRRYAVFCLAQIGGSSSKKALKEALDSESDKCVKMFITATINAFQNKTLPDHITSENRTKWYTTFLCDGK